MNPQVLEFLLFINGNWKPASNGSTFEVINPATKQVIAKVASASPNDVNEAITVARSTFVSGVWSKMTPKERSEILINFGNLIILHGEELAYLECISSGGTLHRIANIDILTCVDVLQQTSKFANDYPYGETLPVMPFPGASNNQIWREPIGVVGAITPWNLPMILAMWKIAPALAMGNSIIVKPSPYAPITILRLAELASKAGVPDGVFNVITDSGAEAGKILATHKEIDKITFTGSTAVGREIMKSASGTLKRVTLELGGKAPAIVLQDADLEITIPGILFGFCLNSGQACESGSRLLVHEEIYDEVVERLVQVGKTIKIGNPLDPTNGMGPIISEAQYNKILSFIETGKKEGARLVLGGGALNDGEYKNGYYISPTIFADVTNEMTIAKEEIFGPVLVVLKYSNIEEAIKIANDSEYGLAGGVWSKDINKALEIAHALKAGTIWINDWHLLRSDAPFGGYKQSGFGRELGRHVLDEYSQIKHVHISLIPELESKVWLKEVL